MKYLRLPGKRNALMRRCTLWLGDDHLLAVDGTGYNEVYSRYHFRDIQAVIVRKTSRHMIDSLILAGLALVTALLTAAFVSQGYLTSLVWSGLFCIFFLVLLLVERLKGATCTCHLQMPIGVHELPSVRRLKQARRMIAMLRSRVQLGQGILPVRGYKLRALSDAESQPAWKSGQFAAGRAVDLAELDGEQSYRGSLHWCLFGATLGDGALSLVQLFYNSLAATLAGWAWSIVIFLLVIMALGKQGKRNVPGAVRVLTWVVLAVYSVTYVLMYFFIMIYSMTKNPEAMQSQWTMLHNIAEINLLDNPFSAAVIIGSTTVLCICAIWGLLAMAGWNRSRHGSK